MLQEDICSPEDILGQDGEAPLPDRAPSVAALARTVAVLLAHATPRSPQNITPYLEYTSDDVETLELNYQRQLRRYSDERHISNFNNDYIDEAEEYQNYENNNAEQFAAVYGNEIRNRGPYYLTNKVQFVTPFCKGDGVLKSGNFEIYDTDEVDFPVEEREVDTERYDRGKMNLDIENNLNSEILVGNEPPTENENRVFYTCLCLGTFVVSSIVLILYPL